MRRAYLLRAPLFSLGTMSCLMKRDDGTHRDVVEELGHVSDDVAVLGGLSLEQLLDHHHALGHHRLCEDKTDNRSGVKPELGCFQQQHQAAETRVRHLGDVGGAAADGLNGGCCELLVLALHVGLEGKDEASGEEGNTGELTAVFLLCSSGLVFLSSSL
ncbi:hypothetical protein EYF80_032777 [Liparis tanakae]|uniref:Uncharacterized protein n=1 Tax=Liparis tanakae TaxID=230148 RepID=A0A4Z2GTN6_9TELE|nr:hypothetical protein EYF80_032777 [Liparis tanakae]